MKFKVGDKVRVISNGRAHYGSVGKVEQVKRKDSFSYYGVRLDTQKFVRYTEGELELVEEPEYTDWEIYSDDGVEQHAKRRKKLKIQVGKRYKNSVGTVWECICFSGGYYWMSLGRVAYPYNSEGRSVCWSSAIVEEVE